MTDANPPAILNMAQSISIERLAAYYVDSDRRIVRVQASCTVRYKVLHSAAINEFQTETFRLTAPAYRYGISV